MDIDCSRGKVYWTDTNNKDAAVYTTYFFCFQNAAGVDIDCSQGKVYDGTETKNKDAAGYTT